MLIYEPYIPFNRIRSKPRGGKQIKRRANPAPAILVSHGAASAEITALDPIAIVREAAAFGVCVDHVLNPCNASCEIASRMEERGYTADEINSMSQERFEQFALDEQVDTEGDPLAVRHADLFWSHKDKAPLVAVFRHRRDVNQVTLQRVFNAEQSSLDGLKIDNADLYRAWCRRYPGKAPPSRFNELIAGGRSNTLRTTSDRIQWRFFRVDGEGNRHKLGLNFSVNISRNTPMANKDRLDWGENNIRGQDDRLLRYALDDIDAGGEKSSLYEIQLHVMNRRTCGSWQSIAHILSWQYSFNGNAMTPLSERGILQ